MKGRIHNGLYQFSLPDGSIPRMSHPSAAQVEYSTQHDESQVFSLWHKRLGHPSSNVVKNVLNKCQFRMNKTAFSDVCTACKKGKFHKLPFLVSTTEYTDPFSLVVSDVWGPASIASGNNWYYVSFIDMSSRFTWVYLIRQKSQVVTCFIQF